jgi:signal transduction histidine kinase
MQRSRDAAQQKGITLETQIEEPLGQVWGDRDKLIQIIDHLLENAIKFSEPDQPITLNGSRRGENALIEVSDHGVGMTAEQMERVFMPFVQGESGLSRRYGGLGMGLSLIQNLVNLHGGDINIRSAPGQGTTMLISLPLFEGSDASLK